MSWLVVPNQIISGNPNAHLAVISGWTQREKIKKTLEDKDPGIMNKLAGIGQLYTSNRGIDMLVRNLLAVPRVCRIFILGADLSGASRDLEAFFSNRPLVSMADEAGEYWGMTLTNIKVRSDIPVGVLNTLRDRVKVTRFDRNTPIDEIVAAIHLVAAEPPAEANFSPVNYPPVRISPDVLPSAVNAHIIRAKTIDKAYLEMLHEIITYGHRIRTHYDQDSLELCNLMIVVTEQEPHPHEVKEFIPFDIDHLLDYQMEIISSNPPPEGVSYKYGHRMRAYFGTDQVHAVAAKLAKDPGSRSAVISLWDPSADKSNSPCLNHVWFRIMNGKLHMTATIRSNDMFAGWPENAYGLRHLQSTVRSLIISYAKNFNDHPGLLPLGDLVTNSQSAHLYEDTWEAAREVVAKHRKWEPWMDEKGEWIIRLDGNVYAEHAYTGGAAICGLIGSGDSSRRRIAQENRISNVSHALWVGYQLGCLDERRENERRMAGGHEVPEVQP